MKRTIPAAAFSTLSVQVPDPRHPRRTSRRTPNHNLERRTHALHCIPRNLATEILRPVAVGARHPPYKAITTSQRHHTLWCSNHEAAQIGAMCTRKGISDRWAGSFDFLTHRSLRRHQLAEYLGSHVSSTRM